MKAGAVTPVDRLSGCPKEQVLDAWLVIDTGRGGAVRRGGRGRIGGRHVRTYVRTVILTMAAATKPCRHAREMHTAHG